MRKNHWSVRLAQLLLASYALLTVSVTAAGTAGTQSDPLVTMSYLNETFMAQLRKFYESYADLWCVKYSDEKLDSILSADIHSHCRLRVNGIVMNSDMWYDLYEVNRNHILYLPPEKRTYIW